jgi:hypothetical protein
VRHRILLAASACAIAAGTATAADEKKPDNAASTLPAIINLEGDKAPKLLQKVLLEPKAMQAKDGALVLGLSYMLTSRPIVRDIDNTDIGPKTGRTNLLSLDFAIKGTYAAKAEVNQDQAVDAKIAGTWTYSPADNWVLRSALAAGYARPQGPGARDFQLALSQGVGVQIPQLREARLFAKAAYARVNPTEDKPREKALGAKPGDYNRVELELFGIFPVATAMIDKIEVRHLRFHEPSAPAAVKAAGLDQFKLSSIYFRLPANTFIAYSRGGVPADRKDSKVLQFGWSITGL